MSRASLRLEMTETHDRSAPAAGFERCIAKVNHVGIARQDAANGFALHANPATVNDAQSNEADPFGLFEPGFHNAGHVPRRHRVEIEYISDGNPNRFVHMGDQRTAKMTKPDPQTMRTGPFDRAPDGSGQTAEVTGWGRLSLIIASI